MGWLDTAREEKVARQRRAREQRKEEQRRLQARRQYIRTLDRMIRANLAEVARRTWGRPFPWLIPGYTIRSDRPSLEPHHSWVAYGRGQTSPPCRVFEVYVQFSPSGDPVRLGVGHQRRGRPVSVYYARWQPWNRETDSISEETLREVLSAYFLRGPCMLPPAPPEEDGRAGR
jgi:hypothetical protein